MQPHNAKESQPATRLAECEPIVRLRQQTLASCNPKSHMLLNNSSFFSLTGVLRLGAGMISLSALASMDGDIILQDCGKDFVLPVFY